MHKLQLFQNGQPHNFEQRLGSCGWDEFRAKQISTLQVNLGKRCNQACHHCHVDASPTRTEQMNRQTIELVLEVLNRHHFKALDITGGAPEINEHFRYLAAEGAGLCDRVIDRSNLTIFFAPGHEDLPEFLAEQGIEVTASLPCYQQDNVDKQRGSGVFDLSIKALQKLNELGYARQGSKLILNLVYNPVGPFLPPPQADLERQYRRELGARFGIEFNELHTITNMPINRFLHDLRRSGKLNGYLDKLDRAFNPGTVDGLMCRHLISVGWDGMLYDCDFNQMLDWPVNHGLPNHIRDFDHYLLRRRKIRTGMHCLGCTAGAGSSCGGALIS